MQHYEGLPFCESEALWTPQTQEVFMLNERLRGTRIVHENHWATVVAPPYETRRIATGNVSGCLVAALVLEVHGVREAYMQHTWPNLLEDALASLDAYRDSRRELELDYARAVIMTDNNGGTKKARAKRRRTVAEMVKIGREIAGDGGTTTIEYLSTYWRRHNLVVALLADGRCTVSTNEGRPFRRLKV